MKPTADLDTGAAVSAGWRVLRRHLRYASTDPRKLLWIARRAWQIWNDGQLRGVLQRHRLIRDFYVDYPAWAEAADADAERRMDGYEREMAQWPALPRFSVLLPVYRPEPSLLQQSIRSVLEQRYPHWELCIVDDASPDAEQLAWIEALAARESRVRFSRRSSNGGIAAATNDALAAATGDHCVFLDQDDVLARSVLFEFAARLNLRPDADVIYGDEDRIDTEGERSAPSFKPDWDPEWLRSTNYVLHPVAIRTTLLRAMGGLHAGLDGVQDWDLLLRVAETAKADAIEHVPRVLYHWREHPGSTAGAIYEKPGIVAAQERALRDSLARRGESATIEMTPGGWRIVHALPAQPPLASVVIPTRDRVELLRRCIDGLRQRTDYPNWEAVIVDNGSTDGAALDFLHTLEGDRRFKLVRDARAFNYAALCNRGVAAATGDIVVLLNNDVEPIGAGWLEELVTQALRPGIGLAGAMLYYPNRTIQHAGVVLGLNGVADRPYIGYPIGFRGVDGRLGAVHCVTAMVTACAAVRRETFLRVGGMDEAFPVACNDLDLCLRIRKLGYRNVVTPFAELVHDESASRGYHYDTPHARQEALDEQRFLEKYAANLECDPCYNVNLTLRGAAYALALSPDDRRSAARESVERRNADKLTA